ncbi:MAG: 4-(cytidine 5'-diphospho)-2-C-methyl-D-erythritol kinase [Angustibacter sp.]
MAWRALGQPPRYPAPMLTDRADRVSVRVPAKINLALSVGPRRPDGYHPVHTVLHAVGLYDDLTVTVVDQPGVVLEVTGEGADQVPADGTNLVARAVAVLAERVGIQPALRLALRKTIPVAGGMAGGSADAAAALVACDLLWQAGLSRDDLVGLAADVGSDVAFALFGGTAIGSGRGERLTPALAQGSYHWVLVVSDQGLSTPQVYAEFDRLTAADAPHPPPRIGDQMMQALRRGDPASLAPVLHNDLQQAACSLRPDLTEVLALGSACGALAGVVSGSGPTVAFLARDHQHALELSVALAASGTCPSVRRAHGPVHGARVGEPSRWG